MGVERGRSFGMPAAEFADRTYAELEKGKVEVLIGMGLVPEEIEQPMVEQRRLLTEAGAENVRKMMAARH